MKNEIDRECELLQKIDLLALTIKKTKDMVSITNTNMSV